MVSNGDAYLHGWLSGLLFIQKRMGALTRWAGATGTEQRREASESTPNEVSLAGLGPKTPAAVDVDLCNFRGAGDGETGVC